jgi:drug/metabolite transporter (DMT)-like permease
MLRGTIIIITAGMMIIFLRKRLYIHHWSSMAVIFTGVFLVGLASIIYSDGNSED